MAADTIRLAAQMIAAARGARRPLEALPAELQPVDEAAGYRVQRAAHELLVPELGGLVGHKIGCTSKVMQDYLGIAHPCAGGVFAGGVHESGAVLREATCRHRRRRSRPHMFRTRSLPAIRRSSTTAMHDGRRWARQP